MTFRAVRILQEVDLIAAEDTRNSVKLLNHFDIHTPMTSYHEYNKYDKGRKLVDKHARRQQHRIDHGCGELPGLSDPGEELVCMCHDARKSALRRGTGTCGVYHGAYHIGAPDKKIRI